MNLPDLKAKLEIYNVAAFLRVIREGETNQRDDAYTLINGGTHLLSYTDHPYAGQSAPPGRAAGAYQFIPHTWQALVKQYGFADFSPGNQDLGAVALVAGRKALDDVIAGNLDAAIAKCRQEWTSLPGAAENTRLTLARCKEVFAQYGGTLAGDAPLLSTAAPPIDNATPPIANPTQDKPMFSLLAMALPAILQAVPELIATFGHGGEISTRNEKAARVIVDTASKALGAFNEQDLIQKLQNDPSAADTVRQAVKASPEVASALIEAGGDGIAGARKYSLDAAAIPIWKNGAFHVTGIVLALVAFVVVWVLVKMTNEQLQTQVVQATLGFATVAMAFWLGSSRGSQQKDEKRP